MTVRKIVGALTWVVLAGSLHAADTAVSQFRAEGDEQEYNLRLDQALSHFNQAVEADPTDPASYRAVAAIYMMRIAFERGAVTADDFLGGEVGGDVLNMPKPPLDLVQGFERNAATALKLGEQRVQSHAGDADAHFQLGAAIALQASYSATVNGQLFSAFKLARQAYKENSKALELDPRRLDAGLIVGAYQYIVSTRSLPVRWLARISGLDSNKTHGIALIEAASRYPGENQTDARLLLVLIYNREQRYDDALNVLSQLQGRYPDNRLLWLEAGATALRAGRFEDAQRLLDSGFGKLSTASSRHAFGEEALWYYKRGASRVGLRHQSDAASDLTVALRKEARVWVHGRAHTELGKLADLTGDHDAARQHYHMAVQMAKSADDSIGLADAEHLLSAPYRDVTAR